MSDGWIIEVRVERSNNDEEDQDEDVEGKFVTSRKSEMETSIVMAMKTKLWWDLEFIFNNIKCHLNVIKIFCY